MKEAIENNFNARDLRVIAGLPPRFLEVKGEGKDVVNVFKEEVGYEGCR